MKINILRAFWNFEVNELSTASGGGGKSYDRPGRQKQLLRHWIWSLPPLPDLKMIDIILRSCSGTSFNLPQCNKQYKRSFVNRCLFAIANDMFCCVLHFVLHIFILLYHTIILSTLIGWCLSDLINDI